MNNFMNLLEGLDESLKNRTVAFADKNSGKRQAWMTDAHWAWYCLEQIARRANPERMSRVVIGVKAQHPLVDEMPGTEYAGRLNLAIEKYQELSKKGIDCIFAVVGGKHEGSDIPLYLAGKNFILERIPEAEVEEFPVIFSGNHEDFSFCELASKMEADLIICCSIGQVNRSLFSCLCMGIYPLFSVYSNPMAAHQDPVLEACGPWSVRGYLEKGPASVGAEAERIAARHKEEATR